MKTIDELKNEIKSIQGGINPIFFKNSELRKINNKILNLKELIYILEHGYSEEYIILEIDRLKNEMKRDDEKFKEWNLSTPKNEQGNNTRKTFEKIMNFPIKKRQIKNLEYLL
jgi:hypothetical protein